MEKNVNDICNVMRKPGGNNANAMPNRRQNVSVIAQENLKLAAFIFHHRWRCIIDREVTGACEDTVHLLASQKRLKDKYKGQDVLPKVNKLNMAWTKEAIKEYLRSCYGVVRVPLVFIIRKTIIVKTYENYSKYATPDNEMIAMMLHLPLDKNKLHNEESTQWVKEDMKQYEIDNSSVYDILSDLQGPWNLSIYQTA